MCRAAARTPALIPPVLPQVRGEWGPVNYPLIPGHEIVGIVTEVGSSVTNFKVRLREPDDALHKRLPSFPRQCRPQSIPPPHHGSR